LVFACNFDGSVRGIWAASVNLTHNSDGKTGDWTFTKDSENSGFSSLTLTLDIATRPNFQLIMGQTEMDYGIGNEPKKGLKILPDKFQPSAQ
jgi:hypothetical protein